MIIVSITTTVFYFYFLLFFYFSVFLKDLQSCEHCPTKLGRCFVNRVSTRHFRTEQVQHWWVMSYGTFTNCIMHPQTTHCFGMERHMDVLLSVSWMDRQMSWCCRLFLHFFPLTTGWTAVKLCGWWILRHVYRRQFVVGNQLTYCSWITLEQRLESRRHTFSENSI